MTFRILSLISLSVVILIFAIDGGKNIENLVIQICKCQYFTGILGPPVVQAHGDHGHSHDEPSEKPAFKYSR